MDANLFGHSLKNLLVKTLFFFINHQGILSSDNYKDEHHKSFFRKVIKVYEISTFSECLAVNQLNLTVSLSHMYTYTHMCACMHAHQIIFISIGLISLGIF